MVEEYDYKEKPKIAFVEWRDSAAFPGWHEDIEVEDFISRPLTVMISIGWLICDNDDFVILAQSIDRDQFHGFQAGELIKVPREMVNKIDIISRGESVPKETSRADGK